MRALLIFSFLTSSASFANLPCNQVLSVDGFSTELKAYKMNLNFCLLNRGDKRVVAHVNYLYKKTKTVYLSLKKYEVIKRSVSKLKAELERKKPSTIKKCSHSSKVQFGHSKSKIFHLCERSEDDFSIKKTQEIIRAVYYSD